MKTNQPYHNLHHYTQPCTNDAYGLSPVFHLNRVIFIYLWGGAAHGRSDNLLIVNLTLKSPSVINVSFMGLMPKTVPKLYISQLEIKRKICTGCVVMDCQVTFLWTFLLRLMLKTKKAKSKMAT